MADVSDVAVVLAQLAQSAIYPNGTGQAAIAANPVIIYPGWPNSQTLQDDLAASPAKVHVSIWPRPVEHITSLAMGDGEWQEGPIGDGATTGPMSLELRRTSRQFQTTVWAPTPALRDTIGAVLDVMFAATVRFDLADGSKATLSYMSQAQHDEQQKVMIYRRDMIHVANFPTVLTVTGTVIQNVETHLQPEVTGPDGPVAIGDEIVISNP